MANVIRPDVIIGTIEHGLIESRVAEIEATVRPFDRQRQTTSQNGKWGRRNVPVIRPTIKFNDRPFVRSANVITSSRRPVRAAS